MLNEAHLLAHQKRAIAINLAGADFLVERVGEDFADRIRAANRTFSKCADIYSFSNKISETVGSLENVNGIIRYERPGTADALNHANNKYDVQNLEVSGDAHEKYNDLIVSAFGLHWTNDIRSALSAILASMKADGLFLAALPMQGTLRELQDSLTRAELELTHGAAMRVDRFVDIQSAGSYLQQAGFALPVVDKQEYTVRYDDLYALIGDLRAMGATSAFQDNVRARSELFARANEIYLRDHSDGDGRIRASYNIAYLNAWAPHASQQKPMKPGSASISLAGHLKSMSKK